MRAPFFRPIFLGASLLGMGLLAQGAVARPPKQVWQVHAPVYFQPESVDVAHLLPAPPMPGSLAAEADLEAVRMAQAFRTLDQEAWAKFIETDGLFKHAPEVGPWFTAQNLPVCDAFFRRVLDDAHGVSDRAKKLYDRPRPPMVDPQLKPCVSVPTSTSFPSGHSMQAFLMASLLADLLPEKRELLMARAHRAAWSRIIGGVHFPTDDIGGRTLAQGMLAELRRSPAFLIDMEACRREMAQASANRSKP